MHRAPRPAHCFVLILPFPEEPPPPDPTGSHGQGPMARVPAAFNISFNVSSRQAVGEIPGVCSSLEMLYCEPWETLSRFQFPLPFKRNKKI